MHKLHEATITQSHTGTEIGVANKNINRMKKANSACDGVGGNNGSSGLTGRGSMYPPVWEIFKFRNKLVQL